MLKDVKHEFIQTNNIKMHYVTQGEGPLVVLLHGFPEFWYSWRNQIPTLAKYFKVVAPDLRGYNKTEKPEGIENYKNSVLLEDILGLIKGLGEEKAIIIGHDWGGALAWEFARSYPNNIEKLVILNCPPISIIQDEILRNKKQARRSQYMIFFQTPDTPEQAMSANNYAMLKSTYTSMAVKKELWTEEILEKYVEALKMPSLTCGINYYRAAYKFPISTEQRKIKIKCPVKVIWGEQDKALGKELTDYLPALVEGDYSIEFIPEAGHWVQIEEPDLVTEKILSFIK